LSVAVLVIVLALRSQFYLARCSPDRIVGEEIAMVKSRQQTARKPATKFANLQKKLQKQKAPVKKPIGKKR
jgi:hypothetical protein